MLNSTLADILELTLKNISPRTLILGRHVVAAGETFNVKDLLATAHFDVRFLHTAAVRGDLVNVSGQKEASAEVKKEVIPEEVLDVVPEVQDTQEPSEETEEVGATEPSKPRRRKTAQPA